MRAFNLFAILIVSFVLVACARANSTPKERQLAGIKQSVLPVFVTGYSTSDRFGFTGKGFKKTATTDFMACSAVYVAPHLLATSVSVFQRENDGVTMYDSDSIAILNGDTWLYSSDVPFFDIETGLVLIRTYAVGTQLYLRDGPLTPTDMLKRVGYTFHLSPSGILAIPSWDIGSATASYAIDSLSLTRMFSAHTEVHIGNCGAALIGDDGRLAGIMNKRIGDEEVSVFGPAAIQAAIESVK